MSVNIIFPHFLQKVFISEKFASEHNGHEYTVAKKIVADSLTISGSVKYWLAIKKGIEINRDQELILKNMINKGIESSIPATYMSDVAAICAEIIDFVRAHVKDHSNIQFGQNYVSFTTGQAGEYVRLQALIWKSFGIMCSSKGKKDELV